MDHLSGSVYVVFGADSVEAADPVAVSGDGEDGNTQGETASSIDEAVSLFADADVDYVVVDAEPRKRTAVELLRSIRDDFAEVPIVLAEGGATDAGPDEGVTTAVLDGARRPPSWDRYEEIVETANDGIYVIDESMQFEFVNQRVVEVSGISRNEWRGEHISVLAGLGILDDRDVATVEAAAEAVLDADDTDEVHVELRPTVPDDVEVIDLRLRPVRTDGDRRIIGYSRDVTELKRRERKLERLQECTRALMGTRTVEVTAQIAVDVAAEVLESDLAEFHRLTADGQRLELISTTDPGRDVFQTPRTYDRPAESDSFAAIVWETFDAGDSRAIETVSERETLAEPTGVESVLVHPVGDRGVVIVFSSEPDDFDEVDRHVVDILGATLAAALRRVDRESLLRERERELSHQNERLDRFAAMVSHDLRNPLNVAQGRLELICDEIDSEHLDPLRRAHERMEELIDDVLTLAREGRTARDVEPIALSNLVEQCWRNVESRSATLVTDTDRTVHADPSRVRQLLENLFRNAVEHGGEDVTVRVGDLDQGFYVEDDGSGIPEADRDRVFDVDYSTSPDGTGYGLRIVAQVVDAHGWTIDVTAGTDCGARFEITGVTTDPPEE